VERAMTEKKKVAILGGGVGAMAAAFALTDTAERRDKYQVTVHQLGWRLGGKGASGRNAEASARIEEHGLHIWMGFYENAFRVMRACYEELGRPPGAPLATWQDAFKQQSYVVLLCKLAGEGVGDDGWFPWTFNFPTNHKVPGDGGELPSHWELFKCGIEWLSSLWNTADEVAIFKAQTSVGPVRSAGGPVAPRAVEGMDDVAGVGPRPPAGVSVEMPAWIAAELEKATASVAGEPAAPRDLFSFIVDNLPRISIDHGLGRLISHIRDYVRSLPDDPQSLNAASVHVLTWLIRNLMSLAWLCLQAFVPTEPWAYKLWVVINLAGAIAVGFLSDGILFHGWQSIDHLDWRAWLKNSGANDVTLGSGPVQAIYDLVFAFVNGDPEKGNFAAGTCMSGLLRMVLTYKGSIFWEMQAGMGDTVFTPFYEVLKKRGVKFELFQRVMGLRLSPDQKRIDAIDLLDQVKLKGDYNPLVEVKGLLCWPSAPLYDQIEDGTELKASGIDLESPYSPPWKDARPRTLQVGQDFDMVVCGISLGAIPYIAPELIRASPAFASMVMKVGTVQTLAFQLWLSRDLAELGWHTPQGISERPVTTAYVEPVDTWADMSHLLPREDWQPPGLAKNASYFCGPLEQLGPTPPFTDHGFPARQKARVQSIARKYLENDVGRLWPLATKAGGHGFRWDYVVSQYYRANVDPSERYVLSVAGSTQCRLYAGNSGFDNLVLAGDWVRTSLNAGCVEAAVEGGLYAAEAVLGEPLEVFARELTRF